MKCFSTILFLSAVFFSVTSADTKWDAVKLTFGPPIPSPFHPIVKYLIKLVPGIQSFASGDPMAEMPLTKSAAEKMGFEKLDEECSGSGDIKGHRYSQKENPTVILLFDANNHIAGIQTRYPEKEMKSDSGVKKWFEQHPMFTHEKIDSERFYTLTAYFKDPDTICGNKRALERAESEVGIDLYFKNGTGHVKIPKEETKISKAWTQGRCFPLMGMHYWYETSELENCDYFQPFFLLYKEGVLNGFGFAVFGHFESSRYEYPPKVVIPLFMDRVPKCMYQVHHDFAPVSTMHVYFNDPGFLAGCAWKELLNPFSWFKIVENIIAALTA